MKTATVREVQRRLASMLSDVQKGQEIAITKRGKVIARIVPAIPADGRLRWPDSAGRMKQLISGAHFIGTPPSKIIRELRGERM